MASMHPETRVCAPREDGHERQEPVKRRGFGLDPRTWGRFDATSPPSTRRDTRPATRSRPRIAARAGAPDRGLVRRGRGDHGTPAARPRDDITGVASQFAYNAFLATVPFLFVLVSIIGLVAEPDTFDEFLAPDADNAIPVELRETFRSALSSATPNTGQAALFLAIGLLPPCTCPPTSWAPWSAASTASAASPPAVGARQARRPGDRARDQRPGPGDDTRPDRRVAPGGQRRRGDLRQGRPERGRARAVPDRHGEPAAVHGGGLPRGPQRPRRRLLASVPGALVGVGLWLGATRLFALYIENFDEYRTVYGALAAAAIYLIFLFLTCVSLLIGAEVNEQIYSMRAARRRANDPTLVA